MKKLDKIKKQLQFHNAEIYELEKEYEEATLKSKIPEERHIPSNDMYNSPTFSIFNNLKTNIIPLEGRFGYQIELDIFCPVVKKVVKNVVYLDELFIFTKSDGTKVHFNKNDIITHDPFESIQYLITGVNKKDKTIKVKIYGDKKGKPLIAGQEIRKIGKLTKKT